MFRRDVGAWPIPYIGLLIITIHTFQDLTLVLHAHAGTEAFTTDWGGGENNWWCPPPGLVVRVVRHAEQCHAIGTLVVPSGSQPLFGHYCVRTVLIMRLLLRILRGCL